MKDEVPQRGCQGSALPASCSGGRNQAWRLLAEGADLARPPCGHRGVLGELQEELHFRRLLKVALTLRLLSWPVLPQWRVRGWTVCGQKCLLGEYSLRLLFLKQSKTIEEAAPPSCSLSCYFTSCSALRNQRRAGCGHLQGGRNEHFWLFK